MVEILKEKNVFSELNKSVKMILTLNKSVKNSFNHGCSPKGNHKINVVPFPTELLTSILP